ncbi:hypothetical protein [Turicibacter sanguinis]|uniref:hypothetical protein n=1 Tax=Turicibacter sanguinis TaxID=154288 RepID=UPI0032EE6FF1
MNNEVLIPGRAGFIVAYLPNLLLDKDYQVIGSDNLNHYYDIKIKQDALLIL